MTKPREKRERHAVTVMDAVPSSRLLESRDFYTENILYSILWSVYCTPTTLARGLEEKVCVFWRYLEYVSIPTNGILDSAGLSKEVSLNSYCVSTH